MIGVHTRSAGLTWAGILLGLVLAASNGAPQARGSDPVAEKELAAGRDPSFASVSSHYPAMKQPREVIGVKEHRDEFIIMPDGRVNFMPVRSEHWRGHTPQNSGHAFFSVGAADTWLGKDGSGLLAKKRLMGGYMPIVIADFVSADEAATGLKCEQTAVAWSEGMSPDEPIWAFVRLKVSNPGDRSRDADLAWHADYGVKEQRIVRTVASWKLKLAPGAEQTVYGKLPFLDGYEQAAESSAEEFEKRLGEASAFWRQLLNRGIRINVPEQRVNDAYRAWLAYTFLNVDKIGDAYEPHDGSGFYEAIFGIMAAKYCNALGVMGYPDEARKYLDSLSTLISPEGHFSVAFGTVDTGVLLLVMARHYELTGDQSWLRQAAPRMVKMCDWIIGQRETAKAEQEKDSLCYGMIQSKLGVDNRGVYFSYVTDMALCVGMEEAAKALRAFGMNDDVARIEKECVAYRQDIVRSMDRAVTEHDGMKILPIMPDTHKYLKRALYTAHEEAPPGKGYTGHGYYSLFACMGLETGFLPAADERFRLITELLERRNGLEMGMCAFGAKGGIDHAFTYGYWMNCLERGEVERALLGFYGSLAYGMSRDTWAGVECTNMSTGANAGTLPHLRSGTQQLRLLRNMLVREEGDRLVLAQAAPQHWLADGKQVAVLDAPTRFGKVSYTIDSHADGGRIAVKLDPPKRTPPEAIVLHLRHPEGAKIKGVSVDGKPAAQFGDGAIILEGLVRPATIEVRYR
ncbi:MAG TPA: hypothetical protein VMY37_34875 [Thermoguttaceae bacterium]|nr:hypothetical protein [Thermoguttaceae bacterium]